MFWSASHTSVSKSVSQGLHLWRKKWKIRLIIVESREWKPSVLSFKFINKVHQLLPLLGFLMNHRICLDKLINGQLRGAFSFALWIFSSPWVQTDHTQTRINLQRAICLRQNAGPLPSTGWGIPSAHTLEDGQLCSVIWLLWACKQNVILCKPGVASTTKWFTLKHLTQLTKKKKRR